MLKWFRNKTILALVVEVNMNEVLEFINEKMKVLLILREYQVEIDGVKLCPLNQQEIANNVPCGKLKANQLINELIDSGYIEMMRSKGRYIITEKGYEILKKMSL
jgi:predicted transcriptional regulator